MTNRLFEFYWDEVKAQLNFRKHGISFDLARTVFHDPRILTITDIDHSESEERWLSVGTAGNAAILSVVYLWSDVAADLQESG